MIQLVAALLMVLIGFGALIFFASAASQPPSRFDLWFGGLSILLCLSGVVRIIWIAF